MRTKRYTRKIRESAILMIIAIIGIAAFQCYWFKNLYNEEWRTLKRETDLSFKNVLFKLQVDRLKKEVQFSKQVDTVFRVSGMPAIVNATAQQRIAISFRTTFSNDTIVQLPPVISRDNAPKKFAITDAFFNFSSDSTMPAVMEYHSDSTKFPSVDSLSIEFRKELAKNKIVMPVSAQRRVIPEPDLKHPRASEGFTKILYIFNPSISYSYEFRMSNQAPYILGRLKWQLLMGILLVAFTTLSFIFLYRNLRKQDQLAAIKNEFISNMTHELKTPISTVKVAVEALRHFDALDDPKRTREYLDISALELQRLSMLVDKVLKLSLFENKEIELNRTNFDLHELAAEVVASMKLQMDKAGAFVQLTAEGDNFIIKADRTHMSSVLSNLLDNALKYGKEAPAIAINLLREDETITLVVSDNGIGIPAAYVGRVFEKFFRVPTGDHHNIKGYGLGLSYVQHIVTKHNGTISVESKEGKGTTFTIKLPVV